MKYLSLLFLSFLMSLSAAEKPNIIMIFVDDMHYGALSFTGSVNTKAKTPHIDSIFTSGVHFPEGYASHATCAPSRGGLMTGRYQARFDHETLPGGTEERQKTNYGVKTSEIMIPALMKKGGYKTAMFGKWHLGLNDQFQPNARGFDYFLGYRGSCSFYQFASQNKDANKGRELKPVEDSEEPRLDIVRNGKSIRLEGYLTEHFTNEASQWIKKEAKTDSPFFIYFAPYNVHGPDTLPSKYIPKGGTAHDGVIAAMDASVGQLLKTVKEAGIADNRLIVFANDNGGKKDYTRTFRGNKATFYEGGVRVPFAMSWPTKIKPGTKFEGMVTTLDMLPTFVALAGVTLPSDRIYDGKNLMPFLNGDKPADQLRDSLFWRNGGARAARVGDWKLVWLSDKKKHRALEAKLGIKKFKGRKATMAERDDSLFLEPELYNLKADIMEANNLAKTNPEKLQELIKAYRAWEATIPAWRE